MNQFGSWLSNYNPEYLQQFIWDIRELWLSGQAPSRLRSPGLLECWSKERYPAVITWIRCKTELCESIQIILRENFAISRLICLQNVDKSIKSRVSINESNHSWHKLHKHWWNIEHKAEHPNQSRRGGLESGGAEEICLSTNSERECLEGCWSSWSRSPGDSSMTSPVRTSLSSPWSFSTMLCSSALFPRSQPGGKKIEDWGIKI